MSALDTLKQKIQDEGAVDIATFMDIALSHYYGTRDPFGAAGDFTTAPEISQMFGELIGLWAAESWLRLGSPSSFCLVEGGPGRGTLMDDALRVTKNVPGFTDAMQLGLLETSPSLRQMQADKLKAFNPIWIERLDDPVLNDKPCIFIANELLDALPIHQLVYHEKQWQEKVVILNNDDLGYGLKPWDGYQPRFFANEGDLFEYAPARENLAQALYKKLLAQKGAMLLIDYGHAVSALGDTLQAVKSHKSVDILHDIGNADITSHVDFGRLVALAKEAGLEARVMEQGRFLEYLGIHVRASQLRANATEAQARDIDEAVHRLTAPDAMGSLFKVMEVLCF